MCPLDEGRTISNAIVKHESNRRKILPMKIFGAFSVARNTNQVEIKSSLVGRNYLHMNDKAGDKKEIKPR